jgi:hypothetical protein
LACDFNIGEHRRIGHRPPADGDVERARLGKCAGSITRSTQDSGFSDKPCTWDEPEAAVFDGRSVYEIDLPGFGGDQNARTPADGTGRQVVVCTEQRKDEECKSEIAHVGIVAPVSSAGCDVRRSARFGRDSRSRHGQVTAATSLYTSGTVGAGCPES